MVVRDEDRMTCDLPTSHWHQPPPVRQVLRILPHRPLLEKEGNLKTRAMGNGQANGKRQTADGKRQTANGKRPTAMGNEQANGKRQAANGNEMRKRHNRQAMGNEQGNW